MPTPELEYRTVAVPAAPAKRKFEDLTNRRFGRWSVISFAGFSRSNSRMWTCRCDCGTVRNVLGQSLRSGKSSGCRKHPKPKLLKDITGRKFGMYFVISRAGKTARNKSLWLCKCDCGKERIVDQSNLVSGNSTSCGHSKVEQAKINFTVHGHTKDHGTTSTYRSWQAMWTRCTNAKSIGWEHYGGRGIAVCPEWSSFEQFLIDMGPRPPKCSLDRYPDNNGNYEKSNCRWATASEQALNKRILKSNKTGYTGINVYLGKKYVARACINGKRKHVGVFPLTPDGLNAAVEAIENAKRLAEVLS